MPSKGSAAERYFAEQPAEKRTLLKTLHGLVISRPQLFAPPDLLTDPRKKLEGSGTWNRMLKVRRAADIDAAGIKRWLKAAVAAGR